MNKEDQAIGIAIAQNVATNGRLFSTLICLLCVLAWHHGYGTLYGKLAAVSVIPIGLAVILDYMAPSMFKSALAAVAYATPAVVTIIFLATIG